MLYVFFLSPFLTMIHLCIIQCTYWTPLVPTDCGSSSRRRTAFLWCSTRRRCIHLATGELSVCGALIRSSTSVRYLGILLESDLSKRRHVAWTVGCCFRQLRLIRSCIKSLPFGTPRRTLCLGRVS